MGNSESKANDPMGKDLVNPNSENYGRVLE
jgi:hypothetical protein